MKAINTLFRYIGYACVSLFLGWCSTQGTNDFIQQIQVPILAMLLTLVVLNTTLVGMLLNEALKLRPTNSQVDVNQMIHAMRRNSVVELILIAISFVFIILSGWLFNILPVIKNVGIVIIDSLLVFDIGCFLLIIFDDLDGWYKLVKHNNPSSN